MVTLPVVWSPTCVRHVPLAEIWLGVRTPGTEVRERAIVLRDAVVGAGARVVEASPHGDEALSMVHAADFLEHLRTVWEQWCAAGLDADPGLGRVVGYMFATEAMLDGLPAHEPAAVHARAGKYCYDTMTLVGPGTWEAARGAVDAALTAVDIVTAGAPLAYAICRPPGHHATRIGYGGSCYLNNAAVAATALRQAGARRVVVLDVDAHHGNGTQSIFYSRDDVWYGSVHVDPGAGWFPHYVGFADEIGVDAGQGATLNIPVPPGSGDDVWLAAVRSLCDWAKRAEPDAVVVSLGVDAAAGDPESPLRVSHDGFRAAGQLIAAVGVPVVAVHEGGYHLPTLGSLTVAALRGLGEVAPPC